MASTIAGVTVKAKAEGLNEINKTAGEINQNLAAAQKSATKLSNTKFAAAAAKRESEDYGVTRSLRPGGTGASARDFAQEAQGLGGLVRLYATYAANIFAVGAAFRALSNAMDTTNMVRGLDQLGAASGTSLGTLSKRLVEVTDGAISLRESMESVAKASSSGMSNENILRMGKVAKQASQALGVDMSNAVDRLTRGITKLEPELLDEVGIFTRVDSAVKEYAKSVGKSTSAITDFEKRMAFANAVLEEGERKFSAIDFETNPYTKLVATLKDVAQSGLEVINKVLAPLVKFMSESPTALGIALAAIGALLVKQALPSIGNFKQALVRQAEEAKELSITKAKEADDAITKIRETAIKRREDLADSELGSVIAQQKAIDELRTSGIKKASAAYKLLDTDFTDFSKQGIAEFEKRVKSVENSLKKASTEVKKYSAGPDADPEKLQAAQKLVELNSKSLELAGRARSAEKGLADEITKSSKTSIIARLTEKAAIEANRDAIKQTVLANAAYNGSLIGVSDAMKLAKVEIEASGIAMGRLEKAGLMAKIGIASVGGAITTVASALSNFMGIIGVFIAVGTMVYSFFTKNDKQLQEFNSSVDRSTESIKNLGRSLDLINTKPFGQQFSTESLLARANAIKEVGDSVVDMSKKLALADKAASGFDKFIDGYKTLWGGDLRTVFAEGVSKTLLAAIERLDGSPESKELKEKIAEILGLGENFDARQLIGAVAAAAGNTPLMEKLAKAVQGIGFASQVAANKVKEFDDALKVASDAYKAAEDKFKVTDSVTVLGEAMVASAGKMAKAFEKPESAIQKLSEAANDFEKMRLFGSEDQANLIKYKNLLDEARVSYGQITSTANTLRKEIDEVSEKMQSTRDSINNGRADKYKLSDADIAKGNSTFAVDFAKLTELRSKLATQEQALATKREQMVQLQAKFPDIAYNQFSRGASLIEAGIIAGAAKGGNALADAAVGILGDLPGTAAIKADLDRQQIAADNSLIQVNLELIKATRENTAYLSLQTARERNTQAQQFDPGERARFGLSNTEQELKDAEEYYNLVKIAGTGTKSAVSAIKDAWKNGSEEVKAKSEELLGYVSKVAGLTAQQASNFSKMKAISLTESVGKLKEEEKVEKARLTASQKKIDNESRLLELSAKLGSISELDLATAKEGLVVRKNENSLQQLNLQFQTENTAAELAIQALKDSGIAKDKVAAAEKALADRKTTQELERQNQVQTGSVALQEAKLETQNAYVKRLQEEREIAERIAKIQDDAYISSVESQNRILELRFTESEQVLGVLEEEKARRKFIFEQEKVRSKIKLDTLRAEISFQADMAAIAKRETLDNMASIQLEREARAKAHAARLGEIQAEGAQELKTIKASYEFSKNKEIISTLSESVVTGMLKGGKEGAKVLRNFIEKELKRKLTIQVEAQISQSTAGKAASAATDFTSTVLSGYAGYDLGPSLVTGLTELGGSLKDLGLYDFGNTLEGFGSSIAEYAGEISAAGAYFSTFMTAMDGDYGAAIGEGIGYYFGGPIGAMIGKEIGSWLGLTDDSGTYHTGGAGSYSTTQGRMTGTSVEQALNFNLEGQNTESIETAAADMSQMLVGIFDSVAETFGLEAGYYAATAFADDTSKDGAWGALMVKLGDKVLIDWENGTDKWPGREFADGEAGQKEYLDAIAKDTLQVLKDMDLPVWATDIINKVGDAPTMQTLQAVLGQINLLNTVFETFTNNLGFSRESLERLIGPLGGVQAATQKLGFFYENFYTDQEKVNNLTSQLTTKFEDLGYALPTSVAQFKSMVLAAEAAGDEELVNNLLELAPAFKNLADSSDDIADLAEDATNKVMELANQVGLASENLATVIVDGYMNGVDGAQIGKMVANTIQRGVQQALIQGVANQIASLITAQIVNPMLQSIIAGGVVSASVSKATMTSVVAQANAMLSALAEVFSSPEFQQLLTDLGNLNFNFANIDVTPAYQYEQTNSNDAAEDARNEALAAVDAAFNALKKAVDAEKKLIQDQIKLAEENLNKLNQLIDVLDSNIKDLRSSVDSTAAMQAAQGQQFITDALAAAISTGVLPDADKLEEAIGAVRAGIDKGNFESKFAEDRAKLILAGELQRLKDLGLEQKTDAELQLEALNAQIDALDAILENAQAQIDALKGIDTSVLTVSEALAKLAAAIAGTPGGGGGSNPPPGGQNPGIIGPGIGGDSVTNKGFSGALTKDYQGVYNLGSVRQQDGKYYYTSTVTDAGGFAGVQSPSDTLISSKPWTTVGYAANNPDVVQYYNQNKALIAQLGQAANLADYLNYHFITYGISENRKFAKGGIFDNAIISAPTLFDTGLMGEAGPEAIMPLGKMPDGSLGVRGNTGDNSELVAEIRTLRAELTHMKQYVAKTSTSTEESRKLLDEVVRGGSAITVESEIATY